MILNFDDLDDLEEKKFMFSNANSYGCVAVKLKGNDTFGQSKIVNPEKVQERVTVPFLRILEFFISNEKSFYCGSDVMKSLNLPSGTVYPLLTRMTTAGWLNRELEDVDPKIIGRPAKRFYQISEVGIKEGRKLILSQKVPITTDTLTGNMEVA